MRLPKSKPCFDGLVLSQLVHGFHFPSGHLQKTLRHRHKENTSKGVEKSLLKSGTLRRLFLLAMVFGGFIEPLHYSQADAQAVGK